MPEELLETPDGTEDETPQGAAADATDDNEDDDDASDDAGGKKGGDLKIALKKEREKRQALAKQVEQLTPLVEEYKGILPLLPALLAQQKERETQQTQQAVDKELLEVAQDFGFETEDGKPDLVRAEKLLRRIDSRSGKIAQRAVQPAQAAAVAAQVADIKERAYKATGPDGKLYAKRDAIDQVFSQIPPEALTNPDNAIAALVMARGLGGPGDDPDPSEPVFSESVRARGKVKRAPSALDKQIAQMRGWDDKKLSKVVEDEPDYAAPLE